MHSRNNSSCATGPRHGGTAENEENTPYIMIYLFGGLGLGLILQAILNKKVIKKRVRLPYTVALLLVGLMIGVSIEVTHTDEAASAFYRKFTMVETNPHLVMYIFLPILIFDASFRMEAHGVFKAMGQILILSTVGLMITSAFIAACLYGVMNVARGLTDWTFGVCLLFGAITSATDPVAVVALLRENGAPRQIVILTEGESLFNDGFAIIAYEVFLVMTKLDLQEDTEVDLQRTLSLQLAGIIISPLLGFIAGKICEILLRSTYNNQIREKGIILVAVYSTFFICEYLDVSGVLSLCVLGIWLSYKKYSISPDSIEDNNKFWDFFSNWANTLIFILAGLVIAKPVARNATHAVEDYGYIVLVYVMLNVGRALMFTILYPVLRLMGHGLTFKHSLVLSWGGLRGAIALLLSLLLLEEEPIATCFMTTIGEKIGLYVSGSVALTLLINATTFQSLLRILRLDAVPSHRRNAMENIVNHLHDMRVTVMRHLKEDRFLAEADWELVASMTRVRNPYEDTPELDPSAAVNDMQAVIQEEARLRLLQVQNVSYWRQFSSGLLSNQAINVLSDVVEETAERTGEHLEVEQLQQTWRVSPWLARIQSGIHRQFRYYEERDQIILSRRPKDKLRGSLFDFLYSSGLGTFLYLLMVADTVLLITEALGLIDTLADYRVRQSLLVIYVIFIIDVILKLAVMCRAYFVSRRNIFDFIFMPLYVANILAILFELKTTYPYVYYALEGLTCLRLIRIYFALSLFLPRIMSFVNAKVTEQVGLAYDTAKGYIVGLEDVNKHLRRLVFDKTLANELIGDSRQKRIRAIKHLAQLQVQQPGAVISVKTRQAAQFCLNSLVESLQDLKESGIVDDKEFELLFEAITDAILHVHRTPPWVDTLPLEKQLEHLTWINGDKELIARILKLGEVRVYDEGQIVFPQNAASDGVYILQTGMMKITLERNGRVVLEEYLQAGRYFGEMGVITGDRRSATVSAEVRSVAYFIPQEAVHQITQKSQTIYYQFVNSYCVTRSSDVLQDHQMFMGLSDVKLKTHLSKGEIIDLRTVPKYRRRNENEILLLMRGRVVAKIGEEESMFDPSDGAMLPAAASSIRADESMAETEPCWVFSVPPINAMFRSLEGAGRRLSVDGWNPTLRRTSHGNHDTIPASARGRLTRRRTTIDGSIGSGQGRVSTPYHGETNGHLPRKISNASIPSVIDEISEETMTDLAVGETTSKAHHNAPLKKNSLATLMGRR